MSHRDFSAEMRVGWRLFGGVDFHIALVSYTALHMSFTALRNPQRNSAIYYVYSTLYDCYACLVK